MMRAAGPEDIPFILSIARERYQQAFDESAAAHWLADILARPNFATLVTENAFAIASVVSYFYAPEEHAQLLFVAARKNSGPWEGYRLVKALRDLVFAYSGAADFTFSASTGVDFTPFAKRLGAKAQERFVIERPALGIALERAA